MSSSPVVELNIKCEEETPNFIHDDRDDTLQLGKEPNECKLRSSKRQKAASRHKDSKKKTKIGKTHEQEILSKSSTSNVIENIDHIQSTSTDPDIKSDVFPNPAHNDNTIQLLLGNQQEPEEQQEVAGSHDETKEKFKNRKSQQYRVQHCAAVNCWNNRFNSPNLSFFRFPRDTERCKQWVVNCGREDLLKKTALQLYSGTTLCSKHFDDNQFACSKLKPMRAIPTIFDFGIKKPIIHVHSNNYLLEEADNTPRPQSSRDLNLRRSTKKPRRFMNDSVEMTLNKVILFFLNTAII